ncbi:hypothetical protein [Salinibacterium sp. ZJ77]|uniref:hypothetical protein n=1 Tax=Salinibacterium sp. ZJ77 TaxID=2708337 RepID=UPI0014241058|nr:hypothetical protein [Salinibacterium sp. ZJ77]
MSARRSSVVIAAVAAAALLTGCSGPGGGPAADEKSPIEKVLEQLYGMDMSPEDQEKQWAEQNAKTEELVSECMQKEGFEYVPNTDNGGIVIGSGEEWKPDDREWVSQYGYGAVNWPGRDEQNQVDTEFVDPNSDYVMSLSESEQTAYYEVLYGTPIENPDPDAEYEWSWEENGCYGWAQNELGDGDMELWNSEEAQAFFEAYGEFTESMEGDPRMVEASAAWVSCMSDAGYSGFSKQYDAQQSIYDELNAFYENQTEWIEDDPALAAIGEKEIEIALADLDCREKTEYKKRSRAVQFELEEQFLAEHKSEVDALLALSKK